MKKITLTALAALTIALSISSCKKGEEDPKFTLLSRKARITGDWKVTSLAGESTRTTTNYDNGSTTTATAKTPYISSKTISHDGSTFSSSYTNPNFVTNVNETKTGTGAVSAHTYTFKKDATWESNYSYTETVVTPYTNFTQTIKTTFTQTESGVWDFTSGVGKENKSKEQLLISVLKSATARVIVTEITQGANKTTQSDIYNDNYTYAPNEKSFVWNIVMLKNKEIKVKATFENTYKGDVTNVNTGGSSDFNRNADVDEKGLNSIVLAR